MSIKTFKLYSILLYSRQQLNYIYQQINLDMKFEQFYEIYTKLSKNNILFIDMIVNKTLIL